MGHPYSSGEKVYNCYISFTQKVNNARIYFKKYEK